ncbi:hemagglutinin repeat-containing protein [Paraburkholderia sp. B3]
MATTGVSQAAGAPSIGVQVSVGSSHSQSQSSEDQTTQVGSNVQAGGTTTFVATGNGTAGSGNVTIAGSNVSASDVVLAAANQVNIVNTTNTDSTRSSNSSSGASVGVSLTTNGFGVSASMQNAHGDANSDAATQNASHVTGTNSVTILSGGDTNITGSQVAGNQVTAAVGGDLNIASVQDTTTSAAHQSSAGGGFSISEAGGSASFSAQTQDVANLSRDTTNTNGTVSNTPDVNTLLNQQADTIQAAQAAGQVVAQGIGMYATEKQDVAQGAADAATKAGDTALATQYQAEADSWAEGGDNRALLHAAGGALIGGLGGGSVFTAVGGGLAAGLTSKYAPELASLANNVTSETGSTLLGNLAGNVAAGVGGALVGGTAGASTASNVYLYNQQVHWGHGDRHVSDPVAARAEILGSLPPLNIIGGPFWGQTQNYLYRAYPLPNGDVNIGTYFYK